MRAFGEPFVFVIFGLLALLFGFVFQRVEAFLAGLAMGVLFNWAWE